MSNSVVMKYRDEILKKALDLPEDIAHSIFLYCNKNYKAKVQERSEQCPKCFFPWIAGKTTFRLVPCPRRSSLKVLLKKEKCGRANRKDKDLLSLHSKNQNGLNIKCEICQYEFMEKLSLPHYRLLKKLEPSNNNSSENLYQKYLEIKERKVQKRKKKVENAGLLIPPELQKKVEVDKSQNEAKICKSQIKKDYNANNISVNYQKNNFEALNNESPFSNEGNELNNNCSRNKEEIMLENNRKRKNCYETEPQLNHENSRNQVPYADGSKWKKLKTSDERNSIQTSVSTIKCKKPLKKVSIPVFPNANISTKNNMDRNLQVSKVKHLVKFMSFKNEKDNNESSLASFLNSLI